MLAWLLLSTLPLHCMATADPGTAALLIANNPAPPQGCLMSAPWLTGQAASPSLKASPHAPCKQACRAWAHLEGLLDAFLAAVLHEFKLAVWGHKADHLLGVELAQVHALVEGHILHSPTVVITTTCVSLVGSNRSRPRGAKEAGVVEMQLPLAGSRDRWPEVDSWAMASWLRGSAQHACADCRMLLGLLSSISVSHRPPTGCADQKSSASSGILQLGISQNGIALQRPHSLLLRMP